MILVVGGAGYIGSHVNKELNRRGYETVVFDNLIYGHKEAVKWGAFEYGDISNTSRLEEVFKKYKIDAVFHFSAFAYVGESVGNPAKYYQNNVAATINPLNVCVRYGVKNFVFSSSCATSGVPETVPITEAMPQNPINPYGRTKFIVEQPLRDYESAYGLHSICLRYFNAAGWTLIVRLVKIMIRKLTLFQKFLMQQSVKMIRLKCLEMTIQQKMEHV